MGRRNVSDIYEFGDDYAGRLLRRIVNPLKVYMGPVEDRLLREKKIKYRALMRFSFLRDFKQIRFCYYTNNLLLSCNKYSVIIF